jgi:hypothetical protein
VSFIINDFANTAKWQDFLVGTGVISEKTAGAFKATVNQAAGDIAALVSVVPQDLSACNLIFKVDRKAARTGIVITDAPISGDPHEAPHVYALDRDMIYGITVQQYGDYPWYSPGPDHIDPVSTDALAEMQITIGGGIITFIYNGVVVYSGLIAESFNITNAYIYLAATGFRGAGLEGGTSTFTTAGYVPPPVFCCTICVDVCFSTQAELDAHMISVHPPLPPPQTYALTIESSPIQGIPFKIEKVT